jgi:hypothetical protein
VCIRLVSIDRNRGIDKPGRKKVLLQRALNRLIVLREGTVA